MKIYLHINREGFSNCYLVVNEKTSEAVIVDPGQIMGELIERIESNSYRISGILITHNHGSHIRGLRTLMKIYAPKIYGADWAIAGHDTTVIAGDGRIRLAGFTVSYMNIPGHTIDSIIYRIENVLFTGDSILAGQNGSTTSSYSAHILRQNIENKIFSLQDSTVILPGHGPPSSVGAERSFNIDMTRPLPHRG